MKTNTFSPQVENIHFDDDILTFWNLLDESIKRFYEVAFVAGVNIIIIDAPDDIGSKRGNNFLPNSLNGKEIINNSDNEVWGTLTIKYYHNKPDFNTLLSRILGQAEKIAAVKERILEADIILKEDVWDNQRIFKEIEKCESGRQILKKAYRQLNFCYQEVVTVARLTNAIRALAGVRKINSTHVAEALIYVSDIKE